MLKHLSGTVARLYSLALKAEPMHFRQELLQLMQALIRFDGAVLDTWYVVMTSSDSKARPDHIAARIIGVRSQAELSHYKSVTSAYFSSLDAPVIANSKADLARHPLPWIRDLAADEQVEKLLLFGEAPVQHEIPRWIVLYRSENRDFTDCDAALLHSCWLHIVQSIDINLMCTLARVDPRGAQRALALVNSRGIIEAADERLTTLLKTEWPLLDNRNMPKNALTSLLASGAYRGKKVQLSATHKMGYLVCAAQEISLISTLSPSEIAAVRCFAGGMTHSAIAGRLGVSPHTVRNQLANAYKKLGVHSKAELIKLMSTP